MAQARPGDPCLDIPTRAPLAPGQRIAVTQLVATGTSGGAQEHVGNLLAHIDGARYDVRVISLSDGSSVRRWRSLGVPVEVIGDADDRAAAAVAERMASWRTAVLHGHMFRAEVVGAHAADLLERRGLPRPWIIDTVHSSRVRSADDRELLRRLAPGVDRLVAVSRSIVDKLDHEGRGSDRVRLVYNGVDLARYDRQEACCTLPEEYGFPPGSPMVGVVGRLEPEKGHATLLEAWPAVLARVPDSRLLIVGEGSRREALEAQAEALEAQAEALGLLGEPHLGVAQAGSRHPRPGARIVFTGRREDVPAVTSALDVAVLPSYREAQGLAVLEAMALSRPVVASAVGGIPEMVTDGVTGLLAPWRPRSSGCSSTTRWPTPSPVPRTTWSASDSASSAWPLPSATSTTRERRPSTSGRAGCR